MQSEIPVRIRVVDPPSSARFGVQSGKTDIVAPVHETADEITFDITVRVGDGRTDGLPNILGPFAQGPPLGRFVYVNSGTRAGQSGSPWTRRAKVPFTGITWEMVDKVLADARSVLEARIAGTARDGGPACATVPLLDGGWRVVRRRSGGGRK